MNKTFSVSSEAATFRDVVLPALEVDREKAVRLAAQGAFASRALGDALLGIILSREDCAVDIVARFRPWLKSALEQREWAKMRNGSPADEARWNEALALYDWLIYATQNADALYRAVTHWFGWYTSTDGQRFRGEIGSLFALAIDAGRCREIIDLYARPLTKPLKPTSATSEAGFGNYLAHRVLQQEGLDPAAEAAFDRFLLANMHEHWLSRGHFKTAAHWLKLRFWNYANPKPEPFAVVRRALDYLPAEAKG